MYNTTKMYTKYAPIIILRDSLSDAQKTKEYLLTLNDGRTIKEELIKIDLYINQCDEAIILLQNSRNNKIRLNNLQVELELIN